MQRAKGTTPALGLWYEGDQTSLTPQHPHPPPTYPPIPPLHPPLAHPHPLHPPHPHPHLQPGWLWAPHSRPRIWA